MRLTIRLRGGGGDSGPASLGRGSWPLDLTIAGAVVVGLSGFVGLTKSIRVTGATA